MMRKLVHVLTVADSLIFIDGVVRQAKASGFDVTVVTSPDERLTAFGRRLGVRTVGVEMPRRVSLVGDAVALDRMRALFERLRPDVVHAGTPKGGLLGMLAAEACGVPVRLYQMRGLPFVTARGALRGVLRTTERLSCRAATHVICQSRSLRAQAIAEGVVSDAQSEVVLEGSNGVDASGRFCLATHEAAGASLRTKLSIGERDVVFGFVGRLVRDKGVPELLAAFERLPERARLLIAGPFEPRDPVAAEVRHRLETHPRVHLLGAVSEPAPIYAASDVVVLPSHREGFPNVPLEAAAMCRPVVSTLVPGCTDAVVDGETGLLVPVGNEVRLAAALRRYFDDPSLRARHGAAGRLRVERSFDRERVSAAMVELYSREIAGI